jgi:hypothetical protein
MSTELVPEIDGQGGPEEPGAAARGISLGVALGGLLWLAAILALRALL